MAKWQNDLMLDAALDWVRARVTKMNVCSSQPTTYLEATSTFRLASVALTSTDLTVSNGDVSGRKYRVAAKSGLSVVAGGTAQHIALTGSTGSTLLVITTCSSVALATGNNVNVPVWDDEIADAA